MDSSGFGVVIVSGLTLDSSKDIVSSFGWELSYDNFLSEIWKRNHTIVMRICHKHLYKYYYLSIGYEFALHLLGFTRYV